MLGSLLLPVATGPLHLSNALTNFTPFIAQPGRQETHTEWACVGERQPRPRPVLANQPTGYRRGVVAGPDGSVASSVELWGDADERGWAVMCTRGLRIRVGGGLAQVSTSRIVDTMIELPCALDTPVVNGEVFDAL